MVQPPTLIKNAMNRKQADVTGTGDMEKLVRRMVIVVLIAVVFAFTTTALVLSKPNHLPLYHQGTSIPCFYSANPHCYPAH